AKLKAADELKDASLGLYQRIADVYKALSDQANESGVPLLLGYSAVVPREKDHPEIQNRTVLLLPRKDNSDGRSGEYAKVHLVPFGEMIPFRGVPVLSNLMLMFSPIDYSYSNTPGPDWRELAWQRFRLPVTTGRVAMGAGTQAVISSSIKFYEF